MLLLVVLLMRAWFSSPLLLAVVVCAALATACFDRDLAGRPCDDARACLAGFVCAEGVCERTGAPLDGGPDDDDDDAGPGDAGTEPLPDAGPLDGPLDAGACADGGDPDGDHHGVGCPLGDDCAEGAVGLFASTLAFLDEDEDEQTTGEGELLCTDGSVPDGYAREPSADEDNCPTESNASQNNIDGDAFGDACDNCAVDVNPGQENIGELNAGAAADTVGDACDPRLAQAGDDYYLVDGFRNDIGSRWRTVAGTWSVVDGHVENAGPELSLLLDTLNPENTLVDVEMQFTSPFDRAAGVAVRAEPPGFNGYACVVDRGAGTVSIRDMSGGALGPVPAPTASAPFALPADGVVRLSFDARGVVFSCTVKPAGPTVAYTSTEFVTGPVAVVAEGALVRFDWIAAFDL